MKYDEFTTSDFFTEKFYKEQVDFHIQARKDVKKIILENEYLNPKELFEHNEPFFEMLKESKRRIALYTELIASINN